MARAFVMHRARRIERTDPFRHRIMVWPVARFVAQRPEDHTCVVLISCHHAHPPIKECFPPFGAAGQLIGVTNHGEAVALNIGLIDDIQTIAIAQFQPARVIGVMRCAHGVDIVLLHEHHILHHRLQRHGVAAVRVEFVPVDTLQFDRYAVHPQLLVSYLDFSEANLEVRGL
jgi:hypothetical protein